MLANIPEKLTSLREGEAVFIEDRPEALERIRNLVYGWAFATGLRGVFKISKESPTRLRILRKVLPSPTIIKEGDFTTIERFVMEELLEVLDEEVAIQKIKDSSLSPGEFDIALKEWKRVQGVA